MAPCIIVVKSVRGVRIGNTLKKVTAKFARGIVYKRKKEIKLMPDFYPEYW